MLTIRPEQFAGFQVLADEHLEQALCDFAREELALWVEGWPPEMLLERVRSGIGRARAYGFTWESSIAKFVALMLRIAPNFDEYPPIAALLARTDIPPEARADLLFTDISPEDWSRAEDRYNIYAWQDYAGGPVI